MLRQKYESSLSHEWWGWGQGCFWNVWHWGRVQAPHGTACRTEGHRLVWSHQHTWYLLPISAALPAALSTLLPTALGARLPASALSQQSFLLQDLPSLPVVSPVLPPSFWLGPEKQRARHWHFSKTQCSWAWVSESRDLSCLPGCVMSLFGRKGSYIIIHFFLLHGSWYKSHALIWPACGSWYLKGNFVCVCVKFQKILYPQCLPSS